MLKAAKKFNGAERRKIDEQEQKYPAELEKIVDMPLITSTNMINVVRREGSTDAANGHTEKAAEATQKCAQVCKPDKRNVVLARNGVSIAKKIEAETSRIPAQSATTNAGVGENDRVKRIATTRGECPKREEEKGELGIELALTPLKNEESPESDRSMNVATGKVPEETNRDKETLSPRVRDVDGECASAREEKKFCFENSRELAGEPDGKADEEEMMEPPALPTSPPPIITTEPRPSFLHGGVNGDSKAKPAVPQKPVTFSAKPSSIDTAPLTVRKISNGDYVLPPPSVQNVVGRSAHNSGELRS